MFNPMQMTGRTVLVTGASSGLGRGCAHLLGRLGTRVVLVARSEDRLRETCAAMEGDGHVVAPFDLNDLDAIPNWMKSIAGELGPIDGLVHSAGIHRLHPLQVSTPANVDELLRINLGAAIALTRGFRQRGVRADAGGVVYISSVMGLVGNRGVSAYAASKGALISMAKSLALELADDGIRVNCVCPGHVETALTERSEEILNNQQVKAIYDMHPIGIGTPEDVANAVAFLLSDAGRWITGQAMVVDGGYTIH